MDIVLFLGEGGKWNNDVERIDFHMTQSACPDIIILMTGDDDVLFDTDCEDLAGRLVSLTTMFCNRGLAKHVWPGGRGV